MPLQAEIQCECALTYMNARSRRNLSDASTRCNEPRAQWTSKVRRTRQCHRHGAVWPDDR